MVITFANVMQITFLCVVVLCRCVAFCKDSEDEFYVLLRWYDQIRVTHPITLLPQLLMTPEENAESYDVQPVSSIVNGALLVESCGYHWALQSPREKSIFESMNGIML